MNKKNRTFFVVLQLVGALIWGLAFAFQSMGMEKTGPFTFTGVRFFLAAAVVYAFSLVRDAGKKEKYPWKSKELWKAGIICGILLSIATNLQQFGIMLTDSVGKAGFITALYIVMLPLCGIFMKKKIRPVIFIGVAVALAGLYFLTISESLHFASGDIFLVLCAFAFTLQILSIEKYSKRVDNVKFACIEFLTVAVSSSVIMFITEKPEISGILAAAIPILYAGAMSGGVAYTIQIICQSKLDAYTASILMSCEALFSVLGGYLLLGQKLTFREIIGSILMFAAILIVQLVPGGDEEESVKPGITK